MHLNDLSEKVGESITSRSTMIPFRFNTIGVSDGISMGTSGMHYSLPSRELIADSVETVMRAQWYDGLICIPGCDKNMPGCLMAMVRLNRPSLILYGGTIKKGCLTVDELKEHKLRADRDQSLDIVSAFQSYGEYISGKIDDEMRQLIVRKACPGAGACGGMYTANTSKFISFGLNIITF